MSFDLMRLAAALLVVVSHTFPLAGEPALTIRGVEDLGALGVSIFFVISGYLVAASYERDPKTYLIKRVLRIEPALIASLFVTVMLLASFSSAPAREYWPAAGLYVLKNALLYPTTYDLPGVFEANALPHVVNGALWTLRLEFTFYLVLMAIRANRWIVLGLGAACLIGWTAISVVQPDWANHQWTRVAALGARNGFLFFAGAAMWIWRKDIPMWAGALAAVAFPLVGVIALPVAVMGLSRPGKLPADLSYGVYIYAFPLQQLLALYGQLNVFTAILAVLPFATASWFLIERPMMKLKPGAGRAW
jgi:peptidoglycan/LPS O-acetylase OafA/YrhL